MRATKKGMMARARERTGSDRAGGQLEPDPISVKIACRCHPGGHSHTRTIGDLIARQPATAAWPWGMGV